MNTPSILAIASVVLAAPCAPSGFAQCSPDTLFANDGVDDDRFGTSVSVSGNAALVGAPLDDVAGDDSGSAYVFERTALGWNQAARLTPNDGAADDWFGWSVDVDGGTAVIGAPGDDDLGANSGSVYVFQRTALGWNQVAKLTVPGAAPGDFFGAAVSIYGDTALVGAPAANAAALVRGAAYVFERSGGLWSLTATLTVSSGTPQGGYIGASVSLADGVALASGTGFDIPGGRAFVFERSAAGTWGPNETAELSPSPGSPTFHFGSSVAAWGDLALVGDRHDNPGSFGSGAVYVFERIGPATWTANETAKLVVNSGQEVIEFGFSVDLEGDLAVVGGFETHGDLGAAYAFRRGATGWTQDATLRPDDAGPAGSYGLAVAISGETVLVGAPDGDGLVNGAGNAYAFDVPTFGTAYCFCNTGAPCFNAYGSAGCANSTGRGALMTACGTASVAADDLVIRVRDLPANEFGLVFMGAGQSLTPFGDGQLCVATGAAGVYRFPVSNSGSAGVLVEGPGIVTHSLSNFPPAGQIAAGQTWNFQGWHRDPFSPCGTGFNVSNAYSVTFTL